MSWSAYSTIPNGSAGERKSIDVIDARNKFHELASGKLLIQMRMVGDIPDCALCLHGIFDNVIPVYERCARRGTEQSGEYLYCGRFSCAIGTKKTKKLSFFHCQAQVVNGFRASERLRQISGLDGNHLFVS
jgi:hypothetical protein